LWQATPLGWALALNGSTDWVELDDASRLIGLARGTLFMVFRMDNPTASQTLFQINDYSGTFGGSPPRNGWRFELYYGGTTEHRQKLSVTKTTDDAYDNMWGDTTITDTGWHTAACVMRPAADTLIYVDGQECPGYSMRAEETAPQGWTDTQFNLDSARIGIFRDSSGSTSVNGLDGQVAGAMAWDRDLTPSEICQLNGDFVQMSRPKSHRTIGGGLLPQYDVAVAETYHAGAQTGELFRPGMARATTFAPGALIGEINA
jgi:hypothetical protein